MNKNEIQAKIIEDWGKWKSMEGSVWIRKRARLEARKAGRMLARVSNSSANITKGLELLDRRQRVM